MNKEEKVIMAILAGSFLGAILGVLYAPAKGAETRNKISKSTAKVYRNIKSKFGDQIGSVNDLREKILQSENNGQLN